MESIDERPDGRHQTRWREGPQKTRHFDCKGNADRSLDAIQATSPTACPSTLPAGAYCSGSRPNSGESGRSTAPRQRPIAAQTVSVTD